MSREAWGTVGRGSEATWGSIPASREDVRPQPLGPSALTLFPMFWVAAGTFWGNSSHGDVASVQQRWSLIINVGKCSLCPRSNSINSTNYHRSSLLG